MSEITNINLVNNEWKHAYENLPKKSVTSLVSLYDLLYNRETGNLWLTDWTAKEQLGYKLDHDIICYNIGNCYNQNTGEVTASAVTQVVLDDPDDSNSARSISYNDASSIWGIYGIDIAIPYYSPNAKYVNLGTCESIFNGTAGTLFNGTSPIHIYDKSAIIPYKDATIFTLNSVNATYFSRKKSGETRSLFNVGITYPDNVANILINETVFPPKIRTISQELVDKISSTEATEDDLNACDILLSHEDQSFLSSVTIDSKNLKPYNYIFLNPYSNFTKMLLYRAIISEYSQSIAFGDVELPSFKNLTLKYKPAYIVKEGYLPKKLGQEVGAEDYLNYILQNTYVWVRAPFFGDYIEPDSYNQDLNQTANVRHSGLMISDNGDFDKYDSYIGLDVDWDDDQDSFVYTNINSVDASKTTPYLPMTSPTVDLVTANAMGEDAYNTDKNVDLKIDTSTSAFISKLQENSEVKNKFEGLPVPPTILAAKSDANLFSPITYFDPERFAISDTQEYTDLGRVPTIIPKNTAYIDGRIISPTIDEIWYMLKKMVSGRKKDAVNTFTKADYQNGTNTNAIDIGIPAGLDSSNRNNDTDTTLAEVPLSEYNFKYGTNEADKIGDTLKIKYGFYTEGKDGLEETPTVIEKFINQNDTIVYPIYKHLQQLSKTVLTKVSATATDATTVNDVGTGYDIVATKPKANNDNGTNTAEWAPREVPYSLRELEAMIMANKYNLLSFATFVQNNYATSSTPRTWSFHDTETNDSYGALFQYHKDFNNKVSSPNTYFNRDGSLPADVNATSANTNGVQATFDDRTTIYTKKASIATKAEYPNVSDYGDTSNLSSFQDKYSSSQVFMAADGTWRYAFEHVRVPILHSQF